MLRHGKDDRTLKANLMLASSTAFVAGVTNVASVIAFLAYTTNVTGHVALLARKVTAQEMDEIITVFTWLLMFLLGAFISNFLVRSYERISKYKAHAFPILLETLILLAVAIYGNHFFGSSEIERKVIICALLFSMGLQNGLVSNVSGGLIKSSHLTGLFTDFGADLAEWLHPTTTKKEAVVKRLYIRITVLGFYFLGGVVGGFLFEMYNFKVFYFIPLILVTILLYDISDIILYKFGRKFTADTKS